MTADLARMETVICNPKAKAFKEVITGDVLDPSNKIRMLNPYIALENFEEDESRQKRDGVLHLQQMNELSPYLEDNIVYVEHVYVAEGYRRHSYCRLMFDILKAQFGDAAIWVNMESAPGEDTKDGENAGSTYPVISVTDVSQVSINACIAQHPGFAVEPDDWLRDVAMESKGGKKTYPCVLIRKTAHYLPEPHRKITAEDGNLVSLGYAMQKEKLSGEKKRQEKAIYKNRGRMRSRLPQTAWKTGRGSTSLPMQYICKEIHLRCQPRISEAFAVSTGTLPLMITPHAVCYAYTTKTSR